jgi:hypothetical protein
MDSLNRHALVLVVCTTRYTTAVMIETHSQDPHYLSTLNGVDESLTVAMVAAK